MSNQASSNIVGLFYNAMYAYAPVDKRSIVYCYLHQIGCMKNM